jgi:acyl-CoA synthetase (NDP forming)
MPGKTSIQKLLQPKCIAIVGASPRTRMGRAVIQNARRIGFAGAVFPVNPNYEEIEGATCYKSLRALPQTPDCVVILVPADKVLPVLEEAGEAGVKAAVVVANGFGDSSSSEGAARHSRLLEIAGRYDMAIAGPNCLGISSVAYRFANTYTDLPPDARAGGISIISQSGGLLNAAASYVNERGGGLNYMISGGNHAVVGIHDYIEFLGDDPATRVIACIMEGVTDGQKFRQAIERVSPKKPIVILKLGRSDAGKRATFAHTGTLAGQDEAFAALFRQNGVAQAASIDDLMETSMLLACAKPPKGGHCVMLTISGGTTGLIADLGEAAGLRFPPLSAATDAALREIFKVRHTLNNPIDTTGWPQLSDEGNLDRALDALLADDGVDLVAISFRLTPTERDRTLIATLARRSMEAAKPILFSTTVSYTALPFRAFAPELADYPILEDLENGQRAISRLVAYGKFRHNRGVQGSTISAAIQERNFTSRHSLTEFESKKLLGEFGLAITREALATDSAMAARLAEEIGYPVALKIQSPDIPHKSDAGGVKLNISSAEVAKAAFDEIMANARRAHPQADIDGVLVQQMVPKGLEVILGMNHDEQLGPVIIVGLGGIFVEVLKDVSLRFPPVSPTDALDMLGELRGAALFEGFRGSPACNMNALAQIITRFSEMVAATSGQFEAIDINPVIAGPNGAVIADALMIPRRS